MLAWEGLLQHCDHADVKAAVFWSLSECQILLVLLRTGCSGIWPKLWSGPGPFPCNLAAVWISPLDFFPLPESGFNTLFLVWKGVLQTVIIRPITMDGLCEDFLRFTQPFYHSHNHQIKHKQTSYAFCGQREFKVLLTEKPVKPRTSLVEPALPKGF